MQISTRPEYLERLFVDVSEEHFKMGFVCFQFFKNGEWKQVFVDTRLPYDPDSKQLLYNFRINSKSAYFISISDSDNAVIAENFGFLLLRRPTLSFTETMK